MSNQLLISILTPLQRGGCERKVVLASCLLSQSHSQTLIPSDISVNPLAAGKGSSPTQTLLVSRTGFQHP